MSRTSSAFALRCLVVLAVLHCASGVCSAQPPGNFPPATLSVDFTPPQQPTWILPAPPGQPPAPGWNNGTVSGGCKTVTLDAPINGKKAWKVIVVYIKFATIHASAVTPPLIKGHATTRKGRNLTHQHWERDLTAVEKINSDQYWDFVFDAPATCQRILESNTVRNCHSYAFTAAGKGTYPYWVDQGFINTAYADDVIKLGSLDPKPPLYPPQVNDLLNYAPGADHTSILRSYAEIMRVSMPPEITASLEWKFNTGGVYVYKMATSLNTPKRGWNPDNGVIFQDADLPAISLDALRNPSVWR